MAARVQPPVGILASADLRASMVLEACQKLRLRVPDDVAVVGVDNDPMVCDFCDPPLTSISRNDYQIGYEAAILLDQLLRTATRRKNRFAFRRPELSSVAAPTPWPLKIRTWPKPFGSCANTFTNISASTNCCGNFPFRAAVWNIASALPGAQPLRLFESNSRRSGQAIAFRSASFVADQNRDCCGFGDLRRFRIVFQRLVNANPAEYRQAAFRIARGEPGPHYTLPAEIPSRETNGRKRSKALPIRQD